MSRTPLAAIACVAALLASCGHPPAPSPGSAATPPGKGRILYYANPMDPTVRSEKPMKDSMGMDYVPVYETQTPGGSAAPGIRLSESQEALIGVRTARVETRTIDRTISTIGKIVFNEKRSALVSARFGGRIERLLVNFTGAPVEAGEPMLIIYSPALVTTQQELLQAAADRGPGGLSSALAGRLFESVQSKLRLWGLTDAQIQGILAAGKPLTQVPIASPISGTVVKLNVQAGQYVEEGAVLYELSDLSRVWAEAEVYEQDLSSVSLRSTAVVTPVSFPDRAYSERVAFVSPSIDPATRTTKIRVELDNADRVLKPGMFVNVMISTPGTERALAIPDTGLLDTGTRKVVYVKTAPGSYVARSVKVRPKAGAFYPVIEGLAEGEEVVVQANFLIDSESQLKGAIQ